MADQIAEFCGACGTPNISKNKFCQKCGTNLIYNTETATQPSALPIPPKMDAAEKTKQIARLREKISHKQGELHDANSIAGPLILGIIGLLTALWLIGILFIILAVVWFVLRCADRPKLRTEIATLEVQLKELERIPALEVQPPEIKPGAVQQPAPQDSTTERITKKTSAIKLTAISFCGIILLVVIAVLIANMSGSSQPTPATPTTVSSRTGDQTAIAKMSEMNNWMTPTMNVIGDSLTDGDIQKAGINAVLLRLYIDNNIQEMRQLAEGATSEKGSAREYVAYLEDLRTASDLMVQATDKYNSGDIDGSTALMMEGTTYTNKATTHLKQSTALM